MKKDVDNLEDVMNKMGEMGAEKAGKWFTDNLKRKKDVENYIQKKRL